MAQEIIDLGTPNGKNGDFVRDAFVKTQNNFDELYSITGNTESIIVTGITVTGNTTKTINLYQSNGSLVQTTFNDLIGSALGGNSITGITFNTGTGNLDLTNSASTITTNLDGRYSLNNHNHNFSNLINTAHTHTISEIIDFTDNSLNWNSSYNDTITGITVTGTINKIITLSQRNGSTLSANFTDLLGSSSGGDVVTNMGFNTTTGNLTLTTLSGNTIIESLDGRYPLNSTLTNHVNDTNIHFNKNSINLSDLGSSAHTHSISDIINFDNAVSSNSAVSTNSAKVGITPQQALDITTNNAKVGITPQQALDITTNNAKVSYPGPQDLSSFITASGNTIFSGVNSNIIHNLSSVSNNITWSGLESNLFKIILTEDSNLNNPTTPVTGAVYQFIVEQDATGLWTLNYGTNFKFSDGVLPVIDLNPNSKGVLTVLYDGTDLLVVSTQNFL